MTWRDPVPNPPWWLCAVLVVLASPFVAYLLIKDWREERRRRRAAREAAKRLGVSVKEYEKAHRRRLGCRD